MMKKFEQDYIKHIDSSAPDMDKLWEKIAGAPDEERISPLSFQRQGSVRINQAKQSGFSSPPQPF